MAILVLCLQRVNKCNTQPWHLALVEQRGWTELWLTSISTAVLSHMPCIKALLSSLQTMGLKGRAGDLFDLFLECNLRHAAEGRQFVTTGVTQVSRKSILVCCYSRIHHICWSNTCFHRNWIRGAASSQNSSWSMAARLTTFNKQKEISNLFFN